MFVIEAQRSLDQIGIESSRQSLVAGEEEQFDALLLTLGEKRIGADIGVALRGRGEIGQHFVEQLRVGTRGQHFLLRPAQLCRRDHLHGPGDLLRVLDRADSPPDIDQAGHGRQAFAASAGVLVGHKPLFEVLDDAVQIDS